MSDDPKVFLQWYCQTLNEPYQPLLDELLDVEAVRFRRKNPAALVEFRSWLAGKGYSKSTARKYAESVRARLKKPTTRGARAMVLWMEFCAEKGKNPLDLGR